MTPALVAVGRNTSSATGGKPEEREALIKYEKMKNLLSNALLLLVFACQAQPAILLSNPSFEGEVGHGKVPAGWLHCSFNTESPPDTHPVPEGLFGVIQKPQDGVSYMGMVVRDNGTYEQVSQKLEVPFQAGQCYSFSLQLCKSKQLLSFSRTTNEPADFNQPVALRIWGGLSPCGKKELLAVSPAILNHSWVKYSFQVKSLDSLNYLTLEAYYLRDAAAFYNGNILIDNLSDIIPIDCNNLQPKVNADTIQVPRHQFEKEKLALENRVGADKFSTKMQFLKVDEAKSYADLPTVIANNCIQVGFENGGSRLSPEDEIRLMKIAYNFSKFPNQFLEMALTKTNQKLDGQRAKAIGNVFSNVGLWQRQYRIHFIQAEKADLAGWSCGINGVWMKVVARKN
jgi:hypothetical protein